MPGPMYRNLDKLAGTAAGVLYGEWARKAQLLNEHLQRSQQIQMENMKADNQLKNRVKVQGLADFSAGERASAKNRTDLEIARLRADSQVKKTDRYYWLRKKGVSEEYIQMLDTGRSIFKEAMDTISSPDPIGLRAKLNPELYKNAGKLATYGNSLMKTALSGMNKQAMSDADLLYLRLLGQNEPFGLPEDKRIKPKELEDIPDF